MNNCRVYNPRAFGGHIDHSNPQTPSSRKVQRTGQCFSRQGSDDPAAKIEPPSWRQCEPNDFLAVRPLNWDDIVDEDDDDANWAEQ